jgi:hypothetical protein
LRSRHAFPKGEGIWSFAHRQTAIAAYGTIPGMRSYKKYSVAKLQQSILNFNHHEVIPQLPEGQHHDAQHRITAKQHHCVATSLRSNFTAKQLHCEATSLRSNFTFPFGKPSACQGLEAQHHL